MIKWAAHYDQSHFHVTEKSNALALAYSAYSLFKSHRVVQLRTQDRWFGNFPWTFYTLWVALAGVIKDEEYGAWLKKSTFNHIYKAKYIWLPYKRDNVFKDDFFIHALGRIENRLRHHEIALSFDSAWPDLFSHRLHK